MVAPTLGGNRMSRPNLNYPFWTAKLAPITDGRNSSFFFIGGVRGKLWRDDYLHNSFGLPYSMDDPEAEKMGIGSVPTAVVSADGKELGRRSSQDLGIPEKALLEILGGD